MRVRVKSIYTFQPSIWDSFDPPVGVQCGKLKPGDSVRVVNLPGCPPANTMRHCHIETLGGLFLGLIATDSLLVPPAWNMARDSAN